MKLQTTRIYAEIERAATQGYTLISEQGGGRSSKTYNTVIWLVVRCLAHPRTGVSVCRATLPALKGSVLRDFEDVMQRAGVWDSRRFNKTELVYKYANGSWVEFFSCDNEQKLRGRKRDILFVNEANEISYMEWQQLKMRTTELAIIDYNPSFGDGHWICEANRDPRTRHFVTTYRDNPFLEPAVIAEIESLRLKNPSLWKIYGEGLQAAVEGLVFTRVTDVSEVPPSPYRRRRYIGTDWGYTNDPTAIVEVIIEEETKTLYLNELVYRTEMVTADIIRELKAVEPPARVISESADPRLVQEIYRAGIDIHPVHKYPGSIEAGIIKMQEYTLAVTRQSVNLRKELRNYTYRQDKEGRWLNQPIDAWNHAIDAVRYVILSEALGGRRRPVDLGRVARALNR